VVLPQFGRFEGRTLTLERLSQELREWIAGIPIVSKPVLSYDQALDLEMLQLVLNDHLPGGWALEDVSGRIDVGRRAAYFLRHGGEQHALHDALASAYACRL